MRRLLLVLAASAGLATALPLSAAEEVSPRIQACAACHVRQTAQFVGGRHGRAMADRSPEMLESACATCHGPVQAHLIDPRKGNVTRRPTDAACVACHRLSRDPAMNTAPSRMKGRVRCLECHALGHEEILTGM